MASKRRHDLTTPVPYGYRNRPPVEVLRMNDANPVNRCGLSPTLCHTVNYPGQLTLTCWHYFIICSYVNIDVSKGWQGI